MKTDGELHVINKVVLFNASNALGSLLKIIIIKFYWHTCWPYFTINTIVTFTIRINISNRRLNS